MTTDTSKPRLRSDLVTRDVADDFLVYDPDNGETYLLNPTAAAIVELCDGTSNAAAIAEEIASITHAEREPVLIDVERTLRDLTEKRLVVWQK